MPRRLLALFSLALLAPNAGAQVKALKFHAVVDSPGHVIPNGVVLVDGDKVSAVLTSNDRLPANAQVIDLTRYTAIPGMIDVHTHMTYYWDSTSGTDPWRQPQRTPAQTIELARANLRRTLETGRSWFWSRSRKEYWCKGETSGDRQFVRRAAYDCDVDVVLLVVEQEGRGACHTGERSCFFRNFGSGATPDRR